MYNNFSEFLPKTDHTEKLMDNVKCVAFEYMSVPIESLEHSKFEYAFKTGEKREVYEEGYIEHRRRLNTFLVMSLYEDSPIYIEQLQNILWAICDEFTWCLPVHARHIKGENIMQRLVTVVDLFAAETAFYLSEAIYLTKNRISKIVYDRVEYEIKRRVIYPFINDGIRWPKNNWSGVCASSIGVVMIYLGMKDKFSVVENDISERLNDFLSSYENDGCCKEGALYWTYGFGFFCYYANLVREYTDGKVNYFLNPKVKKIAQCGCNMFLENNNVIPFSDAPHELNYNIGLFTLLSKEYGLSVPPEKYECRFGDDVRYRMCHMIRDLFWYDDNTSKISCGQKYIYYENAMWYINKNNNYCFAAKGGNNAEPHNHNDLGAFIVYDNGKFIIDDLGWPMYDGKYFGSERYSYICASSKGHSVVQIDDTEQICGSEGFAKLISVSENNFAMDLSAAYASIENVYRNFYFHPEKIILEDEFSSGENNISERFVTRIKPTVEKDGSVSIDNWTVKCCESTEVSITETEFNPRNNIVKSSMNDTETAYLIDFKLKMYRNIVKFVIRKNYSK